MAQKLNISTYGQGNPIVLIHGWGVNSEVWQPVIEPLSAHFQIITVDLPGFASNTENVPSIYSIEAIADAILDALPERFVVIGWSLGGLVATEIASIAKARVKGLVTIASSPCFIEQDGWEGIKPVVLKTFHKQLSGDIKKTIDGFLKIQAMGSPHVRDDIKRIRDLVFKHSMPSQAILDQSLSLLESTDQRKLVQTINMPFLRLYGRLDSLVPKQVIEKVDELVPESKSHILRQASHAPFISDTDEFVETLINWLRPDN